MMLNGGEVKALLGAMSVQTNIRFPEYPNLELSEREQALLDTAESRLLAAQRQLMPDLPRNTPGWLDMLLAGTIEVNLGPDEVRTLSRVVDACLHVLPVDDQHLSALAGLHRLDGM